MKNYTNSIFFVNIAERLVKVYPFLYLQILRSGRQSVSLCYGILKNCVVGKLFYNGSLNRVRYVELPQNQIVEELNRLPLNMMIN